MSFTQPIHHSVLSSPPLRSQFHHAYRWRNYSHWRLLSVWNRLNGMHSAPLHLPNDPPFYDLPLSLQDFLVHVTNRYPKSPQCSSEEYFDELTHIRKNEAARLQRVLEGVNHDIANNMIVLANSADNLNNDSRNIPTAEIQNILLPEWWSHLHDYVQEIDALVWFTTHTWKGMAFILYKYYVIPTYFRCPLPTLSVFCHSALICSVFLISLLTTYQQWILAQFHNFSSAAFNLRKNPHFYDIKTTFRNKIVRDFDFPRPLALSGRAFVVYGGNSRRHHAHSNLAPGSHSSFIISQAMCTPFFAWVFNLHLISKIIA